jgi:hypothetical protein
MLSARLSGSHAGGHALADQRRLQFGHGANDGEQRPPQKDGHPVTPALVACISPYIRDHIRHFGRFALDMAELPTPLYPQPLPFENAL